MITRLQLVLSGIAILCIVTLFFLWRMTANTLSDTQRQLTTAQQTIVALEKDNANLVKFNAQKNNEVKKLEQKYNDALSNIPADACGDVKPSEKLLEFLRKNANGTVS